MTNFLINTNLFKKWISGLIALLFMLNCVNPGLVSAQTLSSAISFGSGFSLPFPGQKIEVTPAFQPALLRGVQIDLKDPFHFEFIVDSGDSQFDDQAFRDESNKLVKYFLAALTVPDDEIWVNLSPYEKDRIVPGSLGITGMGRDMLAQDYLLKQLSASLLDPEDEIGQKFWDRIHKKLQGQIDMNQVSPDLLHKIWILPQKAVVYENYDRAFIVESKLKVMLEEDYIVANAEAVAATSELQHMKISKASTSFNEQKFTHDQNNDMTQIMRDIILPEVEKEINEGEMFAPLRQIYNSLILAVWFKRNLAQSILGQAYVNQNKVTGIDLEDKEMKQKIYAQYLEAFRKGVVDYIREDYDPLTQQIIPRKYFAGGLKMGQEINNVYDNRPDPAMLSTEVKDVGELTKVSVALREPEFLFVPDNFESLELEDVYEEALRIEGGNAVDFPSLENMLELVEEQLEEEKIVLEKKIGESIMTFQEKTILEPEYFGSQFQKGDKILDVHVTGTNAREIIQLFDWLALKETVEEFKEKGFKGLVGNSPNLVILKQFINKLKANETAISKLDAIMVQLSYLSSRIMEGYPEGFKVRRAVVAFEGAEQDQAMLASVLFQETDGQYVTDKELHMQLKDLEVYYSISSDEYASKGRFYFKDINGKTIYESGGGEVVDLEYVGHTDFVLGKDVVDRQRNYLLQDIRARLAAAPVNIEEQKIVLEALSRIEAADLFLLKSNNREIRLVSDFKGFGLLQEVFQKERVYLHPFMMTSPGFLYAALKHLISSGENSLELKRQQGLKAEDVWIEDLQIRIFGDEKNQDFKSFINNEDNSREKINQIYERIDHVLKIKQSSDPLIVFINGTPGTGKTTFQDTVMKFLSEKKGINGSDIHVFDEREFGEEMEGDAFWDNLKMQQGVVIIETVNFLPPVGLQKQDNLVFVHMETTDAIRFHNLAFREQNSFKLAQYFNSISGYYLQPNDIPNEIFLFTAVKENPFLKVDQAMLSESQKKIIDHFNQDSRFKEVKIFSLKPDDFRGTDKFNLLIEEMTNVFIERKAIVFDVHQLDDSDFKYGFMRRLFDELTFKLELKTHLNLAYPVQEMLKNAFVHGNQNRFDGLIVLAGDIEIGEKANIFVWDQVLGEGDVEGESIPKLYQKDFTGYGNGIKNILDIYADSYDRQEIEISDRLKLTGAKVSLTKDSYDRDAYNQQILKYRKDQAMLAFAYGRGFELQDFKEEEGFVLSRRISEQLGLHVRKWSDLDSEPIGAFYQDQQGNIFDREDGVRTDEFSFEGGDMVFSRIGKLFFIEKDEYMQLDESLKNDIGSNIILLEKMDFLDFSRQSGGAYRIYNTAMIVSMMQKNWEDSSFIDYGAGDGILSLVAFKLGAQSLELLDSDSVNLQVANTLFELNGAVLDYDFFIHDGDFADKEFVEESISKIKSRIDSSGLNIRLGVNIGSWPTLYGAVTNQSAANILQDLDGIDEVIFGGYDIRSETDTEVLVLKDQEFFKDLEFSIEGELFFGDTGKPIVWTAQRQSDNAMLADKTLGELEQIVFQYYLKINGNGFEGIDDTLVKEAIKELGRRDQTGYSLTKDRKIFNALLDESLFWKIEKPQSVSDEFLDVLLNSILAIEDVSAINLIEADILANTKYFSDKILNKASDVLWKLKNNQNSEMIATGEFLKWFKNGINGQLALFEKPLSEDDKERLQFFIMNPDLVNYAKSLQSFFEFRKNVIPLESNKKEFELNDYFKFIMGGSRAANQELAIVVESLLLDEEPDDATAFFRDIYDYGKKSEEFLLHRVLSQLKSGSKTLRLRSVGSSTGEEVYSLMIMAYEALEKVYGDLAPVESFDQWVREWDINIDAFDRNLGNFLFVENGLYSGSTFKKSLAIYHQQKKGKDLGKSYISMIISEKSNVFDGVENEVGEFLNKFFIQKGRSSWKIKDDFKGLFNINYKYIDLNDEKQYKVLNQQKYDVTFLKNTVIHLDRKIKNHLRYLLLDIIKDSQAEENLFVYEHKVTMSIDGQKQDNAMLKKDNLGGIDFNAKNVMIEERGNNVQMDQFWGTPDFEIDSIQGFTPVIFNVQPFTSLPAFLGMSQPQSSEQIASAS